MCDFIVTPALAAMGIGGGAAVTGATAAAATGFNMLQTAGLVASLAGTAVQTVATTGAINSQIDAVEQQKAAQRQITAIEDQRARRDMEAQIDQQAAELVARGIDLSSPTAIHLGVNAARELSYSSQSVRSEGQARQIELSSSQQVLRSRRTTARMRGITTAADTFLGAAPDIWPELLS